MTKKLVTRTKFAEMAGVSPAAITKAAAGALIAACDGKRIDAAHADAVLYLKNKTATQTPPPATGIDPLYEEAVKVCQAAGKCTHALLKSELSIGSDRVKALVDLIKASKVPLNVDTRADKVLAGVGKASDRLRETAAVIEENKRTPHVRGTAARRQRLKLTEEEAVEDIPENIAQFADMTIREVILKFGTDTRFVDYLKAIKSIEDIQEKRLKNEQTQGNLVSRDLIRVGIIEPLNTAHVKMMTDGAKAISVRAPAMAAAGAETVDIEKYISGVISSFIKPVAAKVERALKNA